MKLRTIYRIGMAGTAAVLALLLVLVFRISTTQTRLVASEERRAASQKIAQELEESSDDLTLMARLYVVTSNTVYEGYFHAILGIRNGELPRPEGYSPTYWDLVIGGVRSPGAPGASESFQARLARLGFTPSEIAHLSEAQARSDGLVALEERAFAAMKGRFPDAGGQFTVAGRPDPETARRLLHGEEYLRHKALIMDPIGRSMEAVERRTRAPRAGGTGGSPPGGRPPARRARGRGHVVRPAGGRAAREDAADVRALLGEVARLCEEASPDAADRLADLAASLPGPAFAPPLSDLRRALDQLDFDAAREAAGRLAASLP